MNVTPGYFTHWKTTVMVARAGCDIAVIWPIKMWEYCQQQRCVVHHLPLEAINGICSPNTFEPGKSPAEAMEGLYIHTDGIMVTVHQYGDYNLGFVKAWATADKKRLNTLNRAKQNTPYNIDTSHTTQEDLAKASVPPLDDLNTKRREEKEREEKKSKKRAAKSRPVVWFEEFLQTDPRFEQLKNLETFKRLLFQFFECRQASKFPIKTKNPVRLMMLDANKCLDLSPTRGEEIICNLISRAIKSEWRDWYYSEKADMILRDLEKNEAAGGPVAAFGKREDES